MPAATTYDGIEELLRSKGSRILRLCHRLTLTVQILQIITLIMTTTVIVRSYVRRLRPIVRICASCGHGGCTIKEDLTHVAAHIMEAVGKSRDRGIPAWLLFPLVHDAGDIADIAENIWIASDKEIRGLIEELAARSH